MPKPFLEPNWNHPTPGTDDNLAHGYDENCNTHEERKFIAFESQLYLSPCTGSLSTMWKDNYNKKKIYSRKHANI